MKLTRRSFLGVAAAGAAVAATGLPETAARSAPARAAARQLWDPWLEINTANLVWNLRQLEQRVGGKTVMAVVKANGYGHGLVGVAQVLARAGVEHFLVAKLDEARALRQAGVRGMILNFGPFDETAAEEIVRLRLSQSVYSGQVEALARAARHHGRRAHVHIKVDTGLGRVGVPHTEALAFIEHVAGLADVVIDGVFTTFTEEPDFDPVQLERFTALCQRAAERGVRIGLRHAASSDAILGFPAAYEQLDAVRPGITLYGLYPSARAEQERVVDLRPVLALKARVGYVKTLAAGESVGYHRVWRASEPERVATLAVGYSDGWPRALEGKGSVLIGGQRCAIVAISANATIVRLGPVRAESGDEAVLIGRQEAEEMTTSEVARLAGTSVYMLAMGMSPLLPAVHL